MLKLNNISSYYGESIVIKDISMELDSGKFVGVLGKNGMGKTTLLKTLMGLMDKTKGEMFLDNKSITNLSTSERAKHGLGYVPQGRGILPQFTVEENMMLGVFARDQDNQSNVDEDVEFALELFPILKDFQNRRGGDLSGGQQQQLAIARALMTRPKILILDEPTEGIQPNIVEEIEDVLVKLNKEHKLSIILVEQSVGFVKKAADEFVVLEIGEIVEKGRASEISDELVDKYLTI